MTRHNNPSTRFRQQVSRTIQDMQRLAKLAETPEARALLQRQAEALRESPYGRTRLTPRERYNQHRRVAPERDDLITAIRKLGGIDTRIESDWDGRLSHLPKRGFGLPAIERPGTGRTLDDLAESLFEYGYLATRCVWILSDLLSRAESGTPVYALGVGDAALYESHGPDPREHPAEKGPPWEDWTVDPETGNIVWCEPVTAADMEQLYTESPGTPISSALVRFPGRAKVEPVVG